MEATRIGKMIKQFQIDTRQNLAKSSANRAFRRWRGQFNRTLLILSISLIGCYFPITGRVIDAETQQPIEGAVVLVEWTKTHGFGEHWTESYKVFETLSDKNGNVSLPGCYSPFVEPPDVTVYKKGYVAWSSRWIFPTWKSRADFEWKLPQKFVLERFLSSYSYIDHQMFVDRSINAGLGGENKFVS
ncbi:MAG: carboxypeptidase-like regulatory domain-containing protein [Nitrospiraceae bacterium]|nr:carboxypeptidase-like regulatory domain-containing protein [Nitrospiraceae bacterium]